MRSRARMTASAALGGLVLLCVASMAGAQAAPEMQAITHVASLAAGSIHGTVLDEKGAPVAGAMVSALGTTSAFAVTDRAGRFELRTLSPGPYLVRAHSSGFVASRGQLVDVRPSGRSASSIALRHASISGHSGSYPVAAAGFGVLPEPSTESTDATGTAGSADTPDDHGEIAWRLRHVRRGILKEATATDLFAGLPADESGSFGPSSFRSRALSSPARFATNFIVDTPFSGQVNLLTTGSFDSPQQLFSSNNFSGGIAYLALGAPVGEHADWTVRAALTQGDLASWIVAGEYTTRSPARHRYDIGLSYSTQRYEGGNVAALQGLTDGSRNAGALFGFDTFSITPRVTLTYGGRYARYDYLDGQSLLSPRVALTVEPADHFRVSTMLSRRAVAPGAEEFMPRMDTGIWLPPQRTFSSAMMGQPLQAERTNHMEVEVERDIASATVSLRAFHQHVADQLVTLFGMDLPGAPSAIGHYFVGNAGDVNASGLSAGVRAAFAHRVHGSVEYSLSRAQTAPSAESTYLLLLAPSVLRPERERIHDVSTSLETEVPETSTRVVVLYRMTNASPRTSNGSTPLLPIDSRFDVQVRQSLPFMDFSSAKWEMLVGVRNFFRETAADQSMYDEVLVVHPPKRIVGGLTLKF
ncbi:MAG TPA: TonB-dependent receptor [Vicinamibacterales bacterium]|nr:TonB-dependent receptor [Vicinamibacterales bacterium]